MLKSKKKDRLLEVAKKDEVLDSLKDIQNVSNENIRKLVIYKSFVSPFKDPLEELSIALEDLFLRVQKISKECNLVQAKLEKRICDLDIQIDNARKQTRMAEQMYDEANMKNMIEQDDEERIQFQKNSNHLL